MIKENRIAAVFFGILLLCFLIASPLYFLHEADHRCIGENCPICREIAFCRETLKGLAHGGAAAVVISALICSVFLILAPHAGCMQEDTPVTRKIKLLN